MHGLLSFPPLIPNPHFPQKLPQLGSCNVLSYPRTTETFYHLPRQYSQNAPLHLNILPPPRHPPQPRLLPPQPQHHPLPATTPNSRSLAPTTASILKTRPFRKPPTPRHPRFRNAVLDLHGPDHDHADDCLWAD